jgi:hypothetical protein
VLLLLGTLLLAGLWYGIPAAVDVVAERKEQQRRVVKDLLTSLDAPAGFRAVSCDVPQTAACMTSQELLEQSVEAVVALLAPLTLPVTGR